MCRNVSPTPRQKIGNRVRRWSGPVNRAPRSTTTSAGPQVCLAHTVCLPRSVTNTTRTLKGISGGVVSHEDRPPMSADVRRVSHDASLAVVRATCILRQLRFTRAGAPCGVNMRLTVKDSTQEASLGEARRRAAAAVMSHKKIKSKERRHGWGEGRESSHGIPLAVVCAIDVLRQLHPQCGARGGRRQMDAVELTQTLRENGGPEWNEQPIESADLTPRACSHPEPRNTLTLARGCKQSIGKRASFTLLVLFRTRRPRRRGYAACAPGAQRTNGRCGRAEVDRTLGKHQEPQGLRRLRLLLANHLS